MNQRKKTADILIYVLAICLCSGLFAGLVAQQTLPDIKFEKYVLPNGLEVILHVDHSLPMVTVNTWYHVGSKNEKEGRTGFAHLFEHLMFEGSLHVPNFDIPMEKIGGHNNGSTTQDRTNYWSNLPSSYLEMGLWLDADRMRYLMDTMTEENLETQRGVVQNEKRQNYDNRPYGNALVALADMLFPKKHPYSWPVIGSMEDLSAATMEDVKDFFKTYYAPNNASLCVAGDFDPEEAKKMIEKYFASIPPGKPIQRLKNWVPELDCEKRMILEDKVELPRLYYSWLTPAWFAPGSAEFDFLSSILSDGKTSRLYKSLVYDKQIAQDITSFPYTLELGTAFIVIATARPGHSLDEIGKTIDEELAKLLDEGITEMELQRAKADWESGFLGSLERVGGFGGKADILNTYNTILGDPGKLQWDMKRYLDVSVESLMKYTRKHIDLNKRAVLHIIPQGDPAAAAEPEGLDWSVEPPPLPETEFNPPSIQRSSLGNGLEIYLVEDHELPLVQTNLLLKSGWAAEPAGRPGVSSLTAELLDEGTPTRNALQISEEVRSLGAQLNTGSGFDATNVNMKILKKNLDKGLNLMSDIVLNPTFPEEELERQRKIYIGRLQQAARQPFQVALKLFAVKLYGEGHPYAYFPSGLKDEASLNQISRDDIASFYKDNFSPDNAAFVITGDMTMSEAKEMVGKYFGDWRKGGKRSKSIPEPDALRSTHIYIVDKPGAPQSALVMGNLGMKRSNDDFVAMEVVNNVLGGIFTSRINSNLREDKAYTYGARSQLAALKGTGPFLCFSQVQSEFTDESIFEIVKEFRDVTVTRPVAGDELKGSKMNLIKGFPENFETIRGIAGQLGNLVMYDLPMDSWKKYAGEVEKINDNKSKNVAGKYIRPDALLIVVVGDRASIEADIRAMNLGELHFIDTEGNEVK